jgi:hypothetical protein
MAHSLAVEQLGGKMLPFPIGAIWVLRIGGVDLLDRRLESLVMALHIQSQIR